MRTRTLVAVLVLASGALSACDALGSDPGSFELTVTGDATASFSGEPVTIVNPLPTAGAPGRQFQFRLATLGNRNVVSVTAGSEGDLDLAEGTYAVGRFGLDLAPGAAVATADLEGGQTFLSRSGTLTLTEVTDDRVRGSFEFEGVGQSQAVTVRGSFDADLDNDVIT